MSLSGNHDVRSDTITVQDRLLRIYHTTYSSAGFIRRAFERAKIECPAEIGEAVGSRQASFFHGRRCAKVALEQISERDHVGIGRWREPLWPPGVTGSITHTESLAAAVVLPRQYCHGVGLDVEALSRGAELMPAREIVVSAEEYGLLESSRQRLSVEQGLIAVFSAKESFFKAVFPVVGEIFDFSALRLRHLDFSCGELIFDLRVDLCVQFQKGQDCSVKVDWNMFPQHVLTAFLW